MQIAKSDDSSMYLFHRLMTYVRPYWLVLSIGILSTMLFSIVDAGAVYLTKPFINEGFVARNKDFIRWLPIILSVGFIVRGAVSFASSYCMTWVARSVIMRLRNHLFTVYQKLPAAFFDRQSSGVLLSRLLYDIEQVANVSSDAVSTFIGSSFTVIGLLTVMLTISWRLTLFFIVVGPPIYYIIKFTNKQIRKYSHRVQSYMGELTEVAEESLEGFREVRIFGGEAYEQGKFEVATQNCRRGDIKVTLSKSLSSAVIQVIAAFVISMVIYTTLQPGSSFALTPGGFSAFMMAMLTLLKPLKNLSNVNSTIQRGFAGARSVFKCIDEPQEIDAGTRTIRRCRGDIEFRDVGFHYDETQIMAHLNLRIQAGENIALVGHSGSGKTTLVNLLPRFYEISAGSITIDGIDIRELTLTNLREQFALVSQHVTLFNGTVRENIAYGLGDKVNESQIIAAAKSAHCYEFIAKLADGFDTVVGENGVLLSGGQRQRIAIARAILKDAPILILDEATSALDTESERYIQDALQAVMQNRTTIVIAHRLSTIESADRIVVLSNGKIVEMGKHQELLNKQGYYARLHAMQSDSRSVEALPA